MFRVVVVLRRLRQAGAYGGQIVVAKPFFALLQLEFKLTEVRQSRMICKALFDNFRCTVVGIEIGAARCISLVSAGSLSLLRIR